MEKKRNLRRRDATFLLLMVLTTAVYSQIANYQFIILDDDKYLTENRHMQAGLTRKGILWAFTATYASN